MDSESVTSLTTKTLHTYKTDYCSDSVEWCPHAPHQNIFVCANYHLERNTESEVQKRTGHILLFSVHPIQGLQLIQTLETPAILDQKWCHNKINGYSLLGVVNAVNTVEIYKLIINGDSDGKLKLEILCQLKISDDVEAAAETLILSLDWSTGKYECEIPEIICSDSKGNVHRLKLKNEILELCNSWHAHEFEAWIAAFYYWNTDIVFTGGDDARFLQFDLRMGNSPISSNKIHQAGVTTIHSNAKFEHIVATGSYDTYLRLWDIRQMKRAQKELEMPGTLWRLKWDPHDYEFLLAGCMLDGVHIVKVGDRLDIVEHYYEHKDLSYGVDWSYLKEDELEQFGSGKYLIASCSFYDHLLCVWTASCKDGA